MNTRACAKVEWVQMCNVPQPGPVKQKVILAVPALEAFTILRKSYALLRQRRFIEKGSHRSVAYPTWLWEIKFSATVGMPTVFELHR